MFERSDDMLLDMREDPDSGSCYISAFDLNTKEIKLLVLKREEVERLLKDNAELLNPHRSQERCAWLVERITFAVDGGHDTSATSVPLVVTEHDDTFKLPMGTLSASERDKMRDEVISTDGKRERSVREIEARRAERFKAYVESLRRKQTDQHRADVARINAAEESLALDAQNEEAKKNKLLEERVKLAHKRELAIQERLSTQQSYQDKHVDRILTEAATKKVTHEANLTTWKQKRQDYLKKTREEERKFFEEAQKVERKRDQAYQEREMRWHAKSLAYLQERKEKLNAIERNKIVLKEKRQAQAYELFSSQSIPV
jgi:hypothetical protein